MQGSLSVDSGEFGGCVVADPGVGPALLRGDGGGERLSGVLKGFPLRTPGRPFLEVARPRLDQGVGFKLALAAWAVSDPMLGELAAQSSAGGLRAVVGAERELARLAVSSDATVCGSRSPRSSQTRSVAEFGTKNRPVRSRARSRDARSVASRQPTSTPSRRAAVTIWLQPGVPPYSPRSRLPRSQSSRSDMAISCVATPELGRETAREAQPLMLPPRTTDSEHRFFTRSHQDAEPWCAQGQRFGSFQRQEVRRRGRAHLGVRPGRKIESLHE